MPSSQLSVSVDGLDDETEYQVSVSVMTGSTIEGKSLPVLLTPPGRPSWDPSYTNASASSGGDDSAELWWWAASDNGWPIESYIVTAPLHGRASGGLGGRYHLSMCSQRARHHGGLRPDGQWISYTFEVVANNVGVRRPWSNCTLLPGIP